MAGTIRAGAEEPSAGPRIRDGRRSAGLTQQQLAEATGVSRQTVISVETGDYSPSVYLALRIARALGTTVEDLWG